MAKGIAERVVELIDATPADDPVLSVRELLKTFHISESMFYEKLRKPLERDGVIMRIPPHTGSIRIRQSEFVRWLKRQARKR